MNIDFINRLNNYDNESCWQYQIRVDNLESDLELLPPEINYAKRKYLKFIRQQNLCCRKVKRDISYFVEIKKYRNNT